MRDQLAAFLGVAVVVIVTPGPDTFVTIRSAVSGGRRAGIATALGAVSGQLVWALCTAAGVVALLRAWQPAFVALKYAGAAYLAYLGLHALLSAARGDGPPVDGERGPSAGRYYRQGLISNLTNPKVGAFFVSLLPQFAGRDATFAGLLALGLVFAALTLAWLCAYAAAVARAGNLLRGTRVRRVLNAATGAVLLALAGRVAVERR